MCGSEPPHYMEGELKSGRMNSLFTLFDHFSVALFTLVSLLSLITPLLSQSSYTVIALYTWLSFLISTIVYILINLSVLLILVSLLLLSIARFSAVSLQ